MRAELFASLPSVDSKNSESLRRKPHVIAPPIVTYRCPLYRGVLRGIEVVTKA